VCNGSQIGCATGEAGEELKMRKLGDNNLIKGEGQCVGDKLFRVIGARKRAGCMEDLFAGGSRNVTVGVWCNEMKHQRWKQRKNLTREEAGRFRQVVIPNRMNGGGGKKSGRKRDK